MPCRLRGRLAIWSSGTVPCHTGAVRTAAIALESCSISPCRRHRRIVRKRARTGINGWRERLTGLGKEEKEKEHFQGKTAELTPLGRKLLGLDSWEE